jgi:hypothetical protein
MLLPPQPAAASEVPLLLLDFFPFQFRFFSIVLNA